MRKRQLKKNLKQLRENACRYSEYGSQYITTAAINNSGRRISAGEPVFVYGFQKNTPVVRPAIPTWTEETIPKVFDSVHFDSSDCGDYTVESTWCRAQDGKVYLTRFERRESGRK